MNWNNYKNNFISAAKNEEFNKEYIDKWLGYAKNLYDKKLPIIYDQIHFSQLVGLDVTYLLAASNVPKYFYRTFKIPKKTSGKRTIKEPLPDLKNVQQWIVEEILSNCEVSEYTKAYRMNRSIRDNARFHIGQPVLLNIDIEEYFHSISFNQVYKFFLNLGYDDDVSVLLTNLCCLNKSLPQGAPTSPMLSNLITKNMDIEIAEFCNRNKLRYTRYADDISISGDFQPKEVIAFVKTTLNKYHFKTNSKKTNIKYKHERQLVTGVTVNKKLQAPRIKRKELRQTMYFINKYSLESHMQHLNISLEKETYVKQLLGKANHMYYLNNSDKELESYIQDLHQLMEKL